LTIKISRDYGFRLSRTRFEERTVLRKLDERRVKIEKATSTDGEEIKLSLTHSLTTRGGGYYCSQL